jgi:hypothetical protein
LSLASALARVLASGPGIVDNLAMNDTTQTPPLPDRLSIDPKSPHHDAEVFKHPVGIRFNGKDRVDVEEYCISEGWIKVAAGKTLDRKGKPMLIKLKGTVEPYYQD